MDPNEVAGVKFDTDSYKAVKIYNEPSAPKVIRLVMKLSGGAIQEERQAEYVLAAFVVIAICISLFLFFRGSSGSTNKDAVEKTQVLYPELIKL